MHAKPRIAFSEGPFPTSLSQLPARSRFHTSTCVCVCAMSAPRDAASHDAPVVPAPPEDGALTSYASMSGPSISLSSSFMSSQGAGPGVPVDGLAGPPSKQHCPEEADALQAATLDHMVSKAKRCVYRCEGPDRRN